jgi:hypothetical protein
VLGAVGNDVASSAQSKRVGVGIEHGGTELEGGSTRDGGGRMVPAGVSGVLAVIEGGGGSEKACLQPSWGEMGRMGSERGVGGGRASVGGVGNVGQQGDVVVVCDMAVDGVGSGRVAGILGVAVCRSGDCGARGVVCDVAELVGA